ncbi:MAG: hypothetical protein ACOYYU_04300 [Chloroflexota bacterium]
MWSMIGLGMFAWAYGFIRVGYIKKNSLWLERAFVYPPYLIYLICGMPKAKNIPNGVMALTSLIFQLQGLLWIAYGLVYPYLETINIIIQGILLSTGMVLIIIYGWSLYKRNLYKID